ncbi:MAG: dihydroorotate dehydrogenase-like protein [Bacteroidales bacterium]|nr:dihydroorotate dehydrogenase-like protein [Bacteroidales bacterium]
MADLSTQYMGLELKNPIIVGSSELTNKSDKVKELAEAGAGAVVLKSLFEEQIMMEVDAQRVNNMYGSFNDVENYVSFYTRKHDLDEYLELIRSSKESTDIPVIASINCISSSEWVDFARQIEKAGADALELNMFIMPNDPNFSGFELEKIYFDLVDNIQQHIKIPVALKMGTYFSGLAKTFIELSKTNISAMVLFNRFYSPDINLEKESIKASHVFSHPDDFSNSLRWIGILSDQVDCDLSASTGAHDGYTILKNLLVGAKATHVVSTIYKNSNTQIQKMLEQIEKWMDQKGYQSIPEFRGKLSQANIKQPMMYERAQFMKYYSNYRDV